MLLRRWEPLLLNWHNLSAAARVELLAQLGSFDMAFYLACRDTPAYEQVRPNSSLDPRAAHPGQHICAYYAVKSRLPTAGSLLVISAAECCDGVNPKQSAILRVHCFGFTSFVYTAVLVSL